MPNSSGSVYLRKSLRSRYSTIPSEVRDMFARSAIAVAGACIRRSSFQTRMASAKPSGFDTPVVENSIRKKLAEKLVPDHLDIINESYMHNVPRGSETHFKVVVVSSRFENLSLLQRHRLVNDTLQDELKSGVHALSIVLNAFFRQKHLPSGRNPTSWWKGAQLAKEDLDGERVGCLSPQTTVQFGMLSPNVKTTSIPIEPCELAAIKEKRRHRLHGFNEDYTIWVYYRTCQN